MGRIHDLKSLTDAESVLEPSEFSLKLIRLSNSQEADPIQFQNAITDNRRFSSNLLGYVNNITGVVSPPVASIAEAITSLGTENVAHLALFFSLLAQYRQGNCSAI